MLDTLLAKQRGRAIETLNRFVPWHRLPKWLGLANLAELRKILRAENLYDANAVDADNGHVHGPGELGAGDSEVLRARTCDGSYNDLENPRMGMAGTRFGRNIPLERVHASRETLLSPNPRTVSEALLSRRTFVPATSLNVLV